ncbi:MAG: hypothetical protein LUE98_20625 [Tannerellaceae bacterium]|nr:hypothetical protein [Tannerellaceae bacterium]
MIDVVVQPVVEVHQPVGFKIFFRKEPDFDTSKVEEVDGVEFATNPENSFYPLREEKGRYVYETYVTFTKTGNIWLPGIYVTVDGVEYKSRSYPVYVVEKMEIDDTFLKVKLVSDKDAYRLQDTIHIGFCMYSKLSHVSRRPAIDEEELPEGVWKEMLLDSLFANHSAAGLDEVTFDYYATGIKGFRSWLKEHFDIREFVINLFDEEQEMEELDGTLYIKTNIFSARLTPREKGEFSIHPGIFDYTLYKSDVDYSVGSATVRLASNPLKIEVI